MKQSLLAATMVALMITAGAAQTVSCEPASRAPEPQREAAKEQPELRLALCPSGGETAQNVADLAEVALAARDDLILLDRRHVRRVLEEQELIRSGLVNAGQAVKLGKLLGVDLLAVVEAQPDKADDDDGGRRSVGLVVFHAATGIRLWDSATEGQTLEEVAQSVADSVDRSIGKLRSADPHAVTLCVLQVRNAEGPPHMDSRVQAFGRLLERRLISLPSVAVLERRRLELLTDESRLPTDRPLPPLLGSRQFLSIDVSPSSDGKGLAATCRLTDGAGDTLATVDAQCQGEDTYELADRLVEKIAGHLDIEPTSTAVDRRAEADRFAREAWVLSAHKEMEQGVYAAEAAYALDPAGQGRRKACLDTLVEAARIDMESLQNRALGIDHNALNRSLRFMKRALDFRAEEVRAKIAVPQWPANYDNRDTRELWQYFNRLVPRIEAMPHDALPEARALVERYHEIQCDLLGESLFQVADGRHGFHQFCYWTADCLIDLRQAAAYDFLHADRAFVELIDRWATLVERHNPDGDADVFRSTTITLARMYYGDEEQHRILLQDKSGFLKESYQRLAASESRILALSGRRLLLGVEFALIFPSRNSRLYSERAFLGTSTKQPPDLIEAGRRSAMAVCDQAIAEIIQEGDSAEARHLRIAFAQETIRRTPGADLREGYTRLLDVLCEQGLYGANAAMTLILLQTQAEQYEAAHVTIQRALVVLENHPPGMTEAVRQGAINQLVEKRALLPPRQGADSTAPAPWVSVETLFECPARQPNASGPEPLRTILWPVRTDRHVYFLGMRLIRLDHASDMELVLLQHGLDTNQTTRINAHQVHRKIPGNQHGHPANDSPPHLEFTGYPPFTGNMDVRSVRHAIVARQHYFAGTSGCGILVFPLDGGTARVIDTSDGLPSNFVQRLACVGQTLYAWLGRIDRGSYLVRISLVDGKIDVLSSSQRAAQQSPLDNRPPTWCHLILHEEPRHRLVFGLTSPEDREQQGIYQFDLRTDEFRKVVDYAPDAEPIASRRLDDGRVFLAGKRELYRFDPRNDTIEQLFRGGLYGQWSCPILFMNGQVWTDKPFGRIDLSTDRFQAFPRLDTQRNPSRWTVCCVVEKDHVLLYDHRSLLLLTLRADLSEASDR